MILILRKRRLMSGCLLVCFVCMGAVFWAGYRPLEALTAMAGQGSDAPVVVIDPGHGGEDGGAVTTDGTEESGINLAVSLRLEGLLRFAGVSTEMTRRTDNMVCDPGLDTIRARKASDIRNRTAFVNATPHAVLLSIHQNSLPSSPVTHGAQSFWNREEGAETLACVLQEDLNIVINTHRAKEARAISDSIYLMKHVTVPAVLVECGFLSNREEAAQLQRETYQTTLATVIAASYLRWAAGEEHI